MVEVTSRQFREKQRSFFDMADTGEHIVIKRGRKQAYTLTPVNDDNLYFTPEMLARIDRSLQQAREGKVTTIGSVEELDKFLGLS
jgi:hypothetical protein